MEWHEAIDKVKPYLFKIKTPDGYGTGFQIFYSKDTNIIGLATAFHVVEHAYEWNEPIKVVNHVKQKEQLLNSDQRYMNVLRNRDLAFIVFNYEDDDPIEEQLIRLPVGKRLKQGAQMGWCGFPSVSPNDLCFFSGHCSTWRTDSKSYLVDGVAINGVSGGPAMRISGFEVAICGVVTEYRPNISGGAVLPGVCLIRDTGPFETVLEDYKKMDDEIKINREETLKKKTSKKKTSKKKTSKKKTSKKKTSKKKTSKKKTSKKKTSKKKTSKKKTSKKR